MATAQDGLALRSYLLFSKVAAPLYRLGLNRRLKRGKEDPQRYREKLGVTDKVRPPGTLIWMHGVGLGEVLALRSLITALSDQHSDLSFLVTSSTRTSAAVFTRHCPANTIHQFLPVDTPATIDRFLDHWQPDLSVWAEQDIWPALVYYTHERNIPLALVNARMNRRSYKVRSRATTLFKNLYRRFAWVSAQDQNTADHLTLLGANATVGGSLKAAAIQLGDNADTRKQFESALNGRPVWLLASSHSDDEHLALEAHTSLLQQQSDALLIIAPRLIDRKDDIIDQCKAAGLRAIARTDSATPNDAHVYVADTFGEMGLWYRLCRYAFIGGSKGPVQGHNPWEAAALHCAIMHGPNTANFLLDYQSLASHDAAIKIDNSAQLVNVITDNALQPVLARNAYALAEQNNRNIDTIAAKLLRLLPQRL
ncbi:MAG: glycosyltransferase N-terminal domain-containing protein [Pseudomonadota bacterium]